MAKTNLQLSFFFPLECFFFFFFFYVEKLGRRCKCNKQAVFVLFPMYSAVMIGAFDTSAKLKIL